MLEKLENADSHSSGQQPGTNPTLLSIVHQTNNCNLHCTGYVNQIMNKPDYPHVTESNKISARQ